LKGRRVRCFALPLAVLAAARTRTPGRDQTAYERMRASRDPELPGLLK
jgi:hypothetical protein